MNWNLVMENLSFVIVCIVIVAALALGAKFVERFLPERRKVSSARRITIIAICAAIATVLHMLDFPLLFIAPGFYKLDFSELHELMRLLSICSNNLNQYAKRANTDGSIYREDIEDLRTRFDDLFRAGTRIVQTIEDLA
jgi:hypothetical protein